jgi:vancomycin resistance protein YoaR
MAAVPSPPAVSSDDDAPRPSAAPGEGPRRIARWLVGCAAALVIGAGVLGVARSAPADGVVAPGVMAADKQVGGLSEADARAALVELAAALPKRTVTLSANGKEVRVGVAELGVEVDVEATLAAVMTAGRAGGLEGAFRSLSRTRTDVPLVVTVSDTLLVELAAEWERALVDDPPFEGAIDLEGGKPVARAPRSGHRIEVAKLTGLIRDAVSTGGSTVTVPLEAVTPKTSEDEVRRAHDLAAAILAGPITLEHHPTEEEIAVVRAENEDAAKRRKEAEDRSQWRLPKKKSRMKRKGKRLVEEPAAPAKLESLPLPESVKVTFTQEDLVAAFRARRTETGFAVELDEGEVKKKLAPVVAKLFNPSRDARFDIDTENRITIVPSRPGTRVDGSRLVDALYHAAGRPGRVGDLPVDKNAQPKFTTEAAQDLKIKGLVAQYTTHYPCCQPRVKNIHRIANMLDGTIVKAGETFSVNAAVGPRTLERGFVMAPSIGDGEMVDTPGGGVSQFATTLYNALFDGGYVIKERKPHSFYFNRYPVGIEATLSFPHPDLVFYNDTDAAVLVRCEYGETFIRVKLFGDTKERKVDRRVTQAYDFTDPKIEYVADPKREPDDEKVKESGSHGFSVTAFRTITMPDGTKRDERRVIKYNARPRVIEVHPCIIPKGEPGHTGEKCPEKEKDEEGEGGGG